MPTRATQICGKDDRLLRDESFKTQPPEIQTPLNFTWTTSYPILNRVPDIELKKWSIWRGIRHSKGRHTRSLLPVRFTDLHEVKSCNATRSTCVNCPAWTQSPRGWFFWVQICRKSKLTGSVGHRQTDLKLLTRVTCWEDLSNRTKKINAFGKLNLKFTWTKIKKKAGYNILINKLKELDQDTNKDAVVILLFSVAILSSLTTTVLEMFASFY